MVIASHTGEGPVPLVDRDEELTALLRAIEAAREGAGSLTVIAGAAGTGKSSLLAAVGERAQAMGLEVRHGRGWELEQELSFGVIRQLLEAPLRSAQPAERERLLSGAAAAAQRLFADAPPEPAAGDDGGFATLNGLYWLAAGLAARRPLVLAVDDAHWVDAASLRALIYLAGRIADVPIAIAMTLRPKEPSAVAGLLAPVEESPGRIDLTELGPSGTAQVVRAEAPEAGDELCQAFHQASGGNPLYLHELLRAVGSDATVPDVLDAALASVADRVMRRVAALGEGAPALAAAMAVLGGHGRLPDAAEVAKLEESVAAEIALAMRRVEILGGDDPFEWIHPVVRASVYDNLTVTERDALHRRAAETLVTSGAAPGAVAGHLAALRPAGSPDVVAGLLAAADEALARDAPEMAVGLLERAAAEGAPEPPRASLLLRLGRVEVTRRNPAATDILAEAQALATEPRERALALLAQTESAGFAGDNDEAARLLEELIALRDQLDADLALEVELSNALFSALEPARAWQVHRDRAHLRRLARGTSWPARALSAALAMWAALWGENVGDVDGLCDHALGDGVLLGERGAGAYSAGHVLLALTITEQHDRALEVADAVDVAAHEQGSVANVIAATGVRGWIAGRRGDLRRAEELLRPPVDLAAANGMLVVLVTGLTWMTDVLVERESQRDLVAMTESLKLPQAFFASSFGAGVLSLRGRLRALRGERAEAVADLRQAAGIWDVLRFGPTSVPSRSDLALVLEPDAQEEARALVDEELALADQAGLPRPRGIALRADGLITGNDAGIERLRESVAVLEATDARYEHARSLVELGAALRRSGRRGDARGPLDEGLELAHRCGAERLEGHAREELLALGARPRKAIRAGFDALTASERRIVRLAAEGRSNAEIAQELYVSVKTVETHLSSGYRKLNLSGRGARRQLAGIVASDGG